MRTPFPYEATPQPLKVPGGGGGPVSWLECWLAKVLAGLDQIHISHFSPFSHLAFTPFQAILTKRWGPCHHNFGLVPKFNRRRVNACINEIINKSKKI